MGSEFAVSGLFFVFAFLYSKLLPHRPWIIYIVSSFLLTLVSYLAVGVAWFLPLAWLAPVIGAYLAWRHYRTTRSLTHWRILGIVVGTVFGMFVLAMLNTYFSCQQTCQIQIGGHVSMSVNNTTIVWYLIGLVVSNLRFTQAPARSKSAN